MNQSPNGMRIRARESSCALPAEHILAIAWSSPRGWAPHVLKDLQLPLNVTREVVFWFEPEDHIDLFRPERMPVYIREIEHGQPPLYGFPLTGPDLEGVKVGLHGSHDFCPPETVDRTVRSEDERSVRESLFKAFHLTISSYSRFVVLTPAECLPVNDFEGHGLAFIWLMGDLFPSNKTFRRLAFMADGTNSLSTSALAIMR